MEHTTNSNTANDTSISSAELIRQIELISAEMKDKTGITQVVGTGRTSDAAGTNINDLYVGDPMPNHDPSHLWVPNYVIPPVDWKYTNPKGIQPVAVPPSDPNKRDRVTPSKKCANTLADMINEES